MSKREPNILLIIRRIPQFGDKINVCFFLKKSNKLIYDYNYNLLSTDNFFDLILIPNLTNLYLKIRITINIFSQLMEVFDYNYPDIQYKNFSCIKIIWLFSLLLYKYDRDNDIRLLRKFILKLKRRFFVKYVW